MRSPQCLVLPVLASALASAEAGRRECSAAPRPEADDAQPTRGFALLQARASSWRLGPKLPPINVTLEVVTALDPYAGTETGVSVRFLVEGAWTRKGTLCQRATLGQVINTSFELAAWPSKLELAALGDDAFSYSKIELRLGQQAVTVLDAGTGNSSYGKGSVHWVDHNEEAPRKNVFLVSQISQSKVNSKSNTSDEGNKTQTTNCTTRFDPRASATGYTTSPPGTPCIFGLDPRDEGSHCVIGDGAYGSFGWCYTSPDSSSFGSCGEGCPLFGPLKILGDQLKELRKALTNTTTSSPPAPTNTTTVSPPAPTEPANTTTTTTTTAKQAPATTAAKQAPATTAKNAPATTSKR